MDLSNVPTLDLMKEVNKRMGLGAAKSVSKPVVGCRPIVISGPSGVGKGTLVSLLRNKHPEDFGFSVSHTTRKPRPGEKEGVHYHFVSKDEFEEGIKNDVFLEHANVHGNYYGTSVDAVNDIRRKKQIPLIEIDVQGSMQLRDKGIVDAQYVFIGPPSIQELEKRLRGRGTDSEQAIKTRIRNATTEVNVARSSGVYDVFLVNNNLSETFQVFEAVVENNRKSCAQRKLGPRMRAVMNALRD